ncbi:MAG: HAD family phosphatase [Eubacterium sp.]|nr:HAD family phosphatase [Eubacterium sp.]
MDGTLIDTEKIYQKYWNISAKELGYDLTEKDMLLFRSLGHSFAVKLAEQLTGSAEAYDEIRNRRKELMDPVMKEIELQVKPTAVEALTFLKENGVRLGVATATRLDRTEEYLERAGLREYFDELISARSVAQGKPAPDVYLYACSRMNVSPSDAFAIEDAPNGVKAADAAGCKVIMIPDITEPDEEDWKHIVKRADNLLEAAEYIIQA